MPTGRRRATPATSAELQAFDPPGTRACDEAAADNALPSHLSDDGCREVDVLQHLQPPLLHVRLEAITEGGD
ncbi:hypothetical protein O3P69_003948 [Scylla paramamosain]|uniref:Uncharacterized protein n=1 Tax=Scylla paramamosain TaxID=85552 RepID=A0AAW0UFN2_SCYPA